MSILNINSAPVQQIPQAEQVADRIKNETRSAFRLMVDIFNRGSQTFWNNPSASPADIASALGTDAKEIFELHGKLGALLASIKPESIALGSSIVGAFTTNEDGTVTINS